MSDSADFASAFGSANDDVDNEYNQGALVAPTILSDTRPKTRPTCVSSSPSTPPNAPVAKPAASSLTTTTANACEGVGEKAGAEDRSPLPRLPSPVAGSTTSASASQPTLWEEHDIELIDTPQSSLTWCSPVQALPQKIMPTTVEASCCSPALPPPSASPLSGEKKDTARAASTTAEEALLDRGAALPLPPAVTAYADSLDAMSSVERRSVTVTRHPLDEEQEIRGRPDGLYNVHGTPPRPSARLFAPDFDSPGRATEEMQEWRGSDTHGGRGSPSNRAILTTSPTAVSSAPAPPPLSPPFSCNAGACGAQCGIDAARPSSPLVANNYGVVSVIAAEKKSVLPTPYPVTSTSSLADWSSAPRLGFAAPMSPTAASAEVASLSRRDAEEHKREDKWYRLCRGVSLLASATPEAIIRLRGTAREYGIPHHLRSVMWLTLTGMALKVDENEYFCAKLLRRNGYVTGPNADAIAADVQRTFPGHPYFSEKDVGIYKLTNVLHALCWRNPLLSYCQSFNFLAAFLLLVLDDEERVFWLLIHIFEQLLPNDFYGETLLGANVEQAVLERLVHQRLPRVAARFHAAGLQVHTLVANWMMSMFVNIFPPSTALRMWDYLFCRTTNPGERTPAHLEITLAVLKYLEERNLLSGEDAGELLMALREHTACLFDAAAVIRIANAFAITPDELHQLRREAKPTVVQHLKSRERARAMEQERRVAQELQLARGACASAPSK